MTSESLPDKLNSRSADYAAALARGASGLVPFVGPILAEMIGITIPQQRIERIAKFAHELNCRLRAVEDCFLKSRQSDEEFTDLIEEGFRQATRSLSDERRAYIATLIANSLTSDDIDCSESKHLLRFLDEINDIEVIWLRAYMDPYPDDDEEFRETHKDLLTPVTATFGVSSEILAKATLQESYKEHLCQLGLLKVKYRFDREKGMPEYDYFSGSMKEEGYELTELGNILLNEIGIGKKDQCR